MSRTPELSSCELIGPRPRRRPRPGSIPPRSVALQRRGRATGQLGFGGDGRTPRGRSRARARKQEILGRMVALDHDLLERHPRLDRRGRPSREASALTSGLVLLTRAVLVEAISRRRPFGGSGLKPSARASSGWRHLATQGGSPGRVRSQGARRRCRPPEAPRPMIAAHGATSAAPVRGAPRSA